MSFHKRAPFIILQGIIETTYNQYFFKNLMPNKKAIKEDFRIVVLCLYLHYINTTLLHRENSENEPQQTHQNSILKEPKGMSLQISNKYLLNLKTS